MIVNELGALALDAALVVGAIDEVLVLRDGCLCCEVRGDLIRTIHNLLTKRNRFFRPLRFERLVVETSGLASPGPVAQSFLIDPRLAAETRLHDIIAVAHAAHIRDQLTRHPEAVAQLACADQVLLNHADEVSEEALADALSAVRELQPLATVLPTSRADTPIGALLRRGEGPAAWPAVQVEGQEGSAHTPGVQTVVLRHPGPVDLHRLKMLLQLICSRPGWEILRIKGIFRCTDQDRPVVAHGIHQWLELGPGPGNPPLESALMVVGRGIDPDIIGRGWRAALA